MRSWRIGSDGGWMPSRSGPRRVQYVDGMSMLLELALLGLLDAPSRDELIVAPHRLGRPALDGAADRIARDPEWAVPEGTTHRLGRYVRALRPADAPSRVTAATRQAILECRSTERASGPRHRRAPPPAPR